MRELFEEQKEKKISCGVSAAHNILIALHLRMISDAMPFKEACRNIGKKIGYCAKFVMPLTLGRNFQF